MSHFVKREVTPNGTVIEYVEQPRRFYTMNGKESPSVTTVLGCLDKPGLPWWGMKLGAEGVCNVIRESRFVEIARVLNDPVAVLNERKLTVNHVRDKAGDRGSIVHEALETIYADGVFPDRAETLKKLGPDNGGYYDALLAFYEDAKGLTVQDVEVMVGIPGKFAGRYDLRATMDTCELVVRADTGQRATFEAGSYRFDAKTPKGVYATHLLQLDGYEQGAIACGYSKTDAQAVIRLGKDGKYEVVRNTAPEGSFMAIVAAAEAVAAAKPVYPRKARTAK